MLEIELAGVKLRNPTILASGVLGTTGACLQRVYSAGAGAVTCKSIGQKREGNPTPVVAELEDGFMNALGLPCPGPEEMHAELEKLELPLIVSIHGKSPSEFAELAKQFTDRAGLFELNVSCPNVAGDIIGKDAEESAKVTKAVKKVTAKGVFVKLTPDVSDIAEIARAVEKAGADGITAINTVPAMVIDTNVRRPVLSFRRGGLSGRAIHPIAVRCVYDIYRAVEIPIIGTGGVEHATDAIELMLAGATAIGIGTGARDLGVFKRVCDGIETYLREKGLRIEELVGAAHERGGGAGA